ncbi:MAG: hypothetical protein H7X94_07465 [Vallitaleaceae bacterium]|nr:hypothetical protein [Vallitaleaceae bacterium]
MRKKILVNVNAFAVKKVVLSTIVGLDYDFIEFCSEEDLRFKFTLLKDSIILMIHEINYMTYKKDLELIKVISGNGVKTLVITDRYESAIIDEAMDIGANDILVLPLKEEVLKNKVVNLIEGSKFAKIEDAAIAKVFVDENMIDSEIARADRGKYSISLVMVEFTGILDEEVEWFMVKLRAKLRETDIVFRYSAVKLLLICPFTTKENVVEVENKVRAVRSENFIHFRMKVALFVYGISYPKDAKTSTDLLVLLDGGIKNSILLGNIRGTFSDFNKADKETYVKILKKR